MSRFFTSLQRRLRSAQQSIWLYLAICTLIAGSWILAKQFIDPSTLLLPLLLLAIFWGVHITRSKNKLARRYSSLKHHIRGAAKLKRKTDQYPNPLKAQESPPPPLVALDAAEILAHFQGVEDVAWKMFSEFTLAAPQMLAEIEQAIADADGKKLERAAHSLKGSLSYFRYKPAVECAAKLEELGAKSDFKASHTAFQELKAQLDIVLTALEQISSSPKRAA